MALHTFFIRIVFSAAVICLAGSPLMAQEIASDGAESTGLQQRIDFSSVQILGQSIKSGAVYLMHRKQSDISTMLKVRQDYRREIMEDFALESSALIADSGNEDKGALSVSPSSDAKVQEKTERTVSAHLKSKPSN